MTKRIALTISDEILQKIIFYARSRDMSVNDFLNQMIDQGLDVWDCSTDVKDVVSQNQSCIHFK